MKKHSGLLTKLLLIYLVFTLLPLGLIAYLSNGQNYQMVWKNTSNSTTQLSDQILASISSLISDTDYFSGIASEASVRSYLMNSNGAEDYRDAKAILSIFDLYLNNLTSSKNINNIYLIGAGGKSICDRYGVGRITVDDLAIIGQESLLHMSTGKLVTTGNMNPHVSYQDNQFVYIGMPLVIRSLLEPFGAVIVELKNDTVEALCRSVSISDTGAFTVIDKDNRILFGDASLGKPDVGAILEGIGTSPRGDFIEAVSGQDTLIVYNAVPQTDWILVGHVAMIDLMSDAYRFRQTLITVLIIIALCSIALYIYFSNQLILPLRRLKATMKLAAMGDMGVRYQGTTRDEISDVVESFNPMIVELDRMAKQDLKRQSALQKAELDLLQAQINPHFLYNTLDSILWQARVGNNESVVETVDALASFFRTTLSKGSGWIQVREEIRMIQNYLIIQKARYEDLLRYEIDVDPALGELFLLKLTLQPVVENAIYHGLKQRPDGGLLRVIGRSDGAYMLFTVEDDGPGMSPEDLARLKSKLNRYPGSLYDRNDGGFGLRNVNGRIRLYYGEGCGVDIVSEAGVGTTVTIRLRKEADHA